MKSLTVLLLTVAAVLPGFAGAKRSDLAMELQRIRDKVGDKEGDGEIGVSTEDIKKLARLATSNCEVVETLVRLADHPWLSTREDAHCALKEFKVIPACAIEPLKELLKSRSFSGQYPGQGQTRLLAAELLCKVGPRARIASSSILAVLRKVCQSPEEDVNRGETVAFIQLLDSFIKLGGAPEDATVGSLGDVRTISSLPCILTAPAPLSVVCISSSDRRDGYAIADYRLELIYRSGYRETLYYRFSGQPRLGVRTDLIRNRSLLLLETGAYAGPGTGETFLEGYLVQKSGLCEVLRVTLESWEYNKAGGLCRRSYQWAASAKDDTVAIRLEKAEDNEHPDAPPLRFLWDERKNQFKSTPVEELK